ncbi:hypothetical protein AAFX91_27995 [Bradyrhizobium sp. 31Argb]|uniref:hypothetical protein n=1 Tax=Bradyrhizobium sp. 31Argb TaxID=3141247 RepID=UPI003747B0FF
MKPILRSSEPALKNADQARETDRCWFDEHPAEDCYIREFVPGEFPVRELPPIPPGFRYATLVSVVGRDKTGAAILRKRELMAVLERPQDTEEIA